MGLEPNKISKTLIYKALVNFNKNNKLTYLVITKFLTN
ncbi:hypothetical protein SAMN05216490_1553 [Mucilaginibacter mallensis]|uniref:Uncharacterized protein n=1 Tax=Mucilaginibacter mallensis TaxID=652787 RepID=A0A1H1TZK5_MUCMA|nr:hypothetical protein SAMN05216490_1553 [Mucilaginibacter mallensis]